jgi:hypothetical protein
VTYRLVATEEEKPKSRIRIKWTDEQNENIVRLDVIARARLSRLMNPRIPFWPQIGEVVGLTGDACRRRSVVLYKRSDWIAKRQYYEQEWLNGFRNEIQAGRYVDQVSDDQADQLRVEDLKREFDLFIQIISTMVFKAVGRKPEVVPTLVDETYEFARLLMINLRNVLALPSDINILLANYTVNSRLPGGLNENCVLTDKYDGAAQDNQMNYRHSLPMLACNPSEFVEDDVILTNQESQALSLIKVFSLVKFYNV